MLRACLSPEYPLGGAFVKGLHHRRRAESRDPLVHPLSVTLTLIPDQSQITGHRSSCGMVGTSKRAFGGMMLV